MSHKIFSHRLTKITIPAAIGTIVLCVIAFLFHDRIWNTVTMFYALFSDREQIKVWIDGFGGSAPAVFIAAQVLQVILAPVPGEASGFIGGYLFGVGNGFFFSTIGLTIGSCLNFFLGRFLGERYIRKWIPSGPLNRFEALLKRQGVFVIFILFIFPGFPKDYLCLFLGLTHISFRVFIFLAGVGRMPGTLMLSLQGAYVYQQMYDLFALILIVSLLITLFAYVFRNRVYQWTEKSG